MPNRIREVIQSLSRGNILVIGDLILDHYAFGSVSRISPEAPIQVFDFGREEFRLGGAANVAHNIVSLHGKVDIVGIVGKDSQGETLISLLEQTYIQPLAVLKDDERPTTTKTRLICQGHHLLRTDREKRHAISTTLEKQIYQAIEQNITKYNGIIISDYAKGLLTNSLCENIISLANTHHIRVMVGPKGKDWTRYRNAYVLSANRAETEIVSGIQLKTHQDVIKAGHKLLHELNLQGMLITLGAEGMLLVSRDEGELYLEAQALEVFDVVGAGDTVVSVASLVLSCGHSWKTALTLANTSAGVVVGKIGVVTVTPDELLLHMLPSNRTMLSKIYACDSISQVLNVQRQQGKMIVLTWEQPEIISSAYVRFLEYCKSRGDFLVVVVPKNNDIAHVMAGMSSVDALIHMDIWDIPQIISSIKPDVIVYKASEPYKLSSQANITYIRYEDEGIR